MSRKLKVELFNSEDGEVFQRLLLTEDQIRMVEFLYDNDLLVYECKIRVLSEKESYEEV